MAIGIDFVLRANTAGFTKGLAGASNSLHDLKKTFRSNDFGRAFTGAVGVGAIIQGFRTVINGAQEMRDKLEALHQKIPEGTASVARYGDAWDNLKKSVVGAGIEALSVFTRIGERVGDAIVKLKGGGVDSTLFTKIERDMNKQLAARSKAIDAREARNSQENLKKLNEQLQSAQETRAEANATREQKVNALLAQQVKLRGELSALLNNPDVVQNDQAAIAAKKLEIEKKGAQIDASARSSDDLQNKLIQAQTDAFLPSIEDLALFQGGTNTGNAGQNAKGAAAQRARDYFNLQMQSRAAYQQGDLAGALSLSQKADQARFGLLGSAKSDEVNKGKELLDTSNKSLTELEQINKAISGIFVVPGK